MTRDDLEHVWAWANEKLASGEQPPWMWDQYVKICEVLDTISAGMPPATRRPQSKSCEGTHLRLVVDNC